MSTDLMNISAFKGVVPAAAFKVLDPNAESLSDGIGGSYGIVGYKGKNWSLRLRGETYHFVRPDDGSPLAFLDVIVLRQLNTKSKSYYPKDSYQDGQMGVRPICAALDGVTPDSDIATPQSTACATCPRNVFKLTPDGKKTRECSDYKRLAVLILPSLTKQLLGAPLMEPVFLRVPAASLNDLALLGDGMAGQGFHFSSYITRIGFNPEKAHPQMTFRALQPLTDREGPLVLPMREDPTSLRITGENEIGSARTSGRSTTVEQITKVDPAAEAAAAQLAAAALAKAQQVATAEAAAKAAAIEANRVATAKAAADVAAAAQLAASVAPVATGLVDTGFGTVDTGFGDTTPAQVTATVNTAADTGAAEATDDDLDARIAAMLPKA